MNKLLLLLILISTNTIASEQDGQFWIDKYGNPTYDRHLSYDDISQLPESMKPTNNSNGDKYGSTRTINQIDYTNSDGSQFWNQVVASRAASGGNTTMVNGTSNSSDSTSGSNASSGSYSQSNPNVTSSPNVNVAPTIQNSAASTNNQMQQYYQQQYQQFVQQQAQQQGHRGRR